MSDSLQVLVIDSFDQAGIAILQEIAHVDIRPHLTPQELTAIIGNYHALVVGSDTPVPEKLIENGYNLRLIACTGSRLDHIDVSAARTMGIEVRASDAGNTVAVAEQTMEMLLRLASQGNQFPLAHKTLGIIGFGRVGREVAKRARAFDLRILVNQPRLTPELALSEGVEVADLPDLLSQADFVTLHVPFNEETRYLISSGELSVFKAGAYLINTAHAGIVHPTALLHALQTHLAGAALPAADTPSDLLNHPTILTVPLLSKVTHNSQTRDKELARQILNQLRVKPVSESLSLKIVPASQVLPHEYTDSKRVARLIDSLHQEGKLVNPPLVTQWGDHYVVLDGATRSTALKEMGYPYTVVQVVPPDREGFALHTWYHAISNDQPTTELLSLLLAIPHLKLTPISMEHAHLALKEKNALCYLLDRNGQAYLAQTTTEGHPLAALNTIVDIYTRWGNVERTLLTDLGRLLGQFPQMQALAVFPQFSPQEVFEIASRGEFLPAGLTRFIIPGRILRLNLDLEHLRQDESLAAKRSWFNQFLTEKLARSRLRYYQEPVILLDE